MLKALTATPNDFTLTLLRLVAGIVFFAHGAQLGLGWFGGYGYAATMGFFTQQLHIPAPFAFLAIAAQLLGGLGLIVGFLTRIAAFGIGVTMATAALLNHLPNGLFMNWYGSQKGEGFEYHLLAIAIGVTLIIRGAGALSLDRLVASKASGAD
ncbi:MAG: DoxX family protein [Bryobacteraceae bacterium]